MKFRNKLYLKYDEKRITDGAFAQLQRKIALYAICKYFKLNYIEQPLEHLTVTPLDN